MELNGEGDNVGVGSVTDIELRTPPNTAEAGKSILVEWTVANSETWTDRVIASVDAILGNGDDIVLGNLAHQDLLRLPTPGLCYTISPCRNPNKIRCAPT